MSTPTLLTFSSFASFMALFWGLHRAFFSKRSLKVANHFVSAVHAVVVIFLGAGILQSPARALSLVGKATSGYMKAALSVSLGYFIYDLFCCLYIEHIQSEPDLANSFHHTVCIIGLFVAVFKAVSGAEILACIVISEVSTPFLHARFIMKEYGTNQSIVGVANEVLFAMTFFLFRIVMGPFLTLATLMSPTSHILVKLCGLGVQGVSYVWFTKIVRIAVYKLRTGLNETPRHLKL